MRVLITGIGGLLGSRFAEWLLQRQPEVEIIGVDDFSCGYEENVMELGPRVRFYQRTLGQSSFLDVPPADLVYHFAAYAAEGLSPFIRCYNYRNNLLATAEVVNYCLNAKVKRLVFTSSMAVYGNGWAPFREEDSCHPIDPYGNAKLACERDIEIAGEQHDLDWCIIRPHNIYGPGQSIWQKYRNVLGNWMARCLQGEPLLVYGQGNQQRAFSYVEDCLPCLWKAGTSLRASREIINLGGTIPYTIREAAETLVGIMGSGSIEYAEPRHEVSEAWCTWDKSIELLDYQHKTGLEEGLRQMWTWAKSAWNRFPERRGSHERIGLEVERGLYSFWRR